MRESSPPRQPQKQPSEPKLTKVSIPHFLLSIWKPLGLWWWGVWGVYTAVVANTAGKDYPFFGILMTILFVFCIYGTFWLRGKIKPPEKAPDRLISGVYFGEQSGIPIGKPINEDGHILVIGGAGSGKSACIAIPTLKYFWDGRFLAVDIKGELAQKSGRKAHIFNPTDSTAQGFDPFYLLKETRNPISAIKEIALAIVPSQPNAKDPYWINSAQSILTGHLLYCYRNGATFAQAVRVLHSTPSEILLDVDSEDEDARMLFQDFANTKKEQLSSIMTELKNHTEPFATDPELQQALSAQNGITPELLEQGRDIFLQVPEYKIKQWGGLITLILQQFLNHFERRAEDNATPILFLLDEFARFGKLEGIVHGLATLRSKKITICILIQSLAQLDATYGADQRKIIADNCGYKAILRATDAETQRYFSQLVGTEEQEQRSVSGTAKFLWKAEDITNVSYSMVDKVKIKPEDFAYLSDIVLLTPREFSRVQKVGYYQMQGRQSISQRS